MKEIKITKEQALEMHQSGIESLKSIAESNFPELFHREKKWEDFGKVSGFYIGDDCDPSTYRAYRSGFDNKDVNPTAKECEMDIAMCQLRQWRDKANRESIFDWCDWSDLSQPKFVIYRGKCEIILSQTFYNYHELAFKTREIMDKFFKDHNTLIHTAKGLTFNK